MKSVRRLIPWFILAVLMSAVAWSWQSEGIVYELLRADADAATRIEKLKAYFTSMGAWAPVVYVLFVIVEVVVAPIPGLMLYAPGGIVFGPVLGGSLTLIGNILGAGISSALTRSFGDSWLSRFFEAERLERAQNKLESRGPVLIFLLRLNPLTSSDLVSYAAGFTRIPISKIMLATGAGMAPLCFAQAWLADSLLARFPGLVYPLLAACAVYVIFVIVVIRKMLRTTEERPQESDG